MNYLRWAGYFLAALLAPNWLQRHHDREYMRQRDLAEGVKGTLWLLGIDPQNYLELRDSEICSVCHLETWIWFPGDQQCAPCMRAWLDSSFKAASKKRKK
jgi:hypothetical protein